MIIHVQQRLEVPVLSGGRPIQSLMSEELHPHRLAEAGLCETIKPLLGLRVELSPRDDVKLESIHVRLPNAELSYAAKPVSIVLHDVVERDTMITPPGRRYDDTTRPTDYSLE